MINFNNLNNKFIKHNIIYNQNLIYIKDYNNNNLLNIIDLINKQILIFLENYCRDYLLIKQLESFYMVLNRTFSNLAMLSWIRFNEGFRFIVINKKRRKKLYYKLVSPAASYRIFNDVIPTSIITFPHRPKGISKRTLANSKRADFRKGKHADRYEYNKHKKKNSYKKKVKSCYKAKRSLKKRKAPLGIPDIISRKILHRIARKNKKDHQRIKIISNNKYKYVNDTNKVVKRQYLRDKWEEKKLDMYRYKFWKKLLNLIINQEVAKRANEIGKLYYELDRVYRFTKKFAAIEKLQSGREIEYQKKDKKIYNKYYIHYLPKDSIKDKIPNLIDLKYNIKKKDFYNKRPAPIKLIESMLYTGDLKINKKSIYMLNILNYINKNKSKVKKIKLNFSDIVYKHKKKKIKQMSYGLKVFKKILIEKTNKNDDYLKDSFWKPKEKKRTAQTIIDDMYNAEELTIIDYEENYLAIKYEPPYLENFNKEFIEDFVKREAIRIKNHLTSDKILVNQKKEAKEKREESTKFNRKFVKKSLKESLCRVIEMRIYPKIEMYYETMYAYTKALEFMEVELWFFLLPYFYLLRYKDISIDLIENFNKLLIGASYDNNIIDSIDIYRHTDNLQENEAYMYDEEVVQKPIINLEEKYTSDNEVVQKPIINLEEKYTSDNEMHFYIKEYNEKYYDFTYKNIFRLQTDPFRFPNMSIVSILKHYNKYLDRDLEVYYVNYKTFSWIRYNPCNFWKYEPEKSFKLKWIEKEFRILLEPRLLDLIEALQQAEEEDDVDDVWDVFFDQFRDENKKICEQPEESW